MGLSFSGLSIAGMQFGKKEEGPKPFGLSPYGKQARAQLYQAVQQGMAGKGLTEDYLQQKLLGLKGATGQARPEFESYLKRSVLPEDAKVMNYARGMFSQLYPTMANSLRQENELRKYNETLQSQAMGTELLGLERGMGQQVQNLYNQNQYQGPTFGSQLGYGLGSAGGWVSAAQRWAQMGQSGGMT